MICPDQKEFLQLSRQGNVVPVWTSVPADLLTPVSAYLKLTQGRATARSSAQNFSFLLESVEGGETIARYTYMGADPFLILRFWLPATGGGSGTVAIAEKGRTRQLQGNLMSAARGLLSSFRPVRVAELPPFTAGAVGYLGYDLVSQMEPVLLPASGGRKGSRRSMPDATLMFYSTLLVFDHVKHQIIIIRNVRLQEAMSQKSLRAAYAQAEREIHRIERKLQAPLALSVQTSSASSVRLAPSVQSNFTKEQFEEKVHRAKEHIRAGDIFQVVLSQRLETRITVEPFEIYRALRRVNPSPYLFFLRMGEDCVLGSSPEMLVKVSGEERSTAPSPGRGLAAKTR